MLFSTFGEVGVVVIGLMWVLNKWFDSFIDAVELLKNMSEVDSSDEQKHKDLPDSIKQMYS